MWQEVLPSAPVEPLLSSLRSQPLSFALPHTIRRVTHAAEPPAAQFALIENCYARYAQLFDSYVAASLSPADVAEGVLPVLDTLTTYEVRAPA